MPATHGELSPFLEFGSVILPPRLPANDKLSLLLQHTLAKKTMSTSQQRRLPYFWDEARFGLDQCSLFKNMTESKRSDVLAHLTNHFLAEATAIERAGISYSAKMILLAESEEEKTLYAIMAHDEAVHLREIENFVDFDTKPMTSRDPFLKLISEAIRVGAPGVCQSVLQVALEGYGMMYYTFLRNHCLDPVFETALRRIIKDEAVHHGSGVILTEKAAFNSESKALVRELFGMFTFIMQCWALPIVHAMEMANGGISRDDKRRILSDIGMESKTVARLEGIRQLIGTGPLPQILGEPWLSGTPKAFTAPQVLAAQQALFESAG